MRRFGNYCHHHQCTCIRLSDTQLSVSSACVISSQLKHNEFKSHNHHSRACVRWIAPYERILQTVSSQTTVNRILRGLRSLFVASQWQVRWGGGVVRSWCGFETCVVQRVRCGESRRKIVFCAAARPVSRLGHLGVEEFSERGPNFFLYVQ